MRRHTPAFVATVAAACCLLLALAAAFVQAGEKSIDEQIYTGYETQSYCVRLTHQTGTIGCGLPADGTRGRLRLALDQTSLNRLVASPPSYRVALLLPVTLLRASTLRTLMSSGLKIAGILVLPQVSSDPSTPAPLPVGGYSPAPSRSQQMPYIPSQPGIPGRPLVAPMFNNSYQWNPLGDGMSEMTFDFAIVAVEQGQVAGLTALASTNEEHEAQDKFVSETAEFFYYMYAQENTVRCLDDATCVPVGGFSVWGSLGNMTSNSTSEVPIPMSSLRPLVLALSKMDSTAFMHQSSPGAEETLAGLTVLTTALRALANTPGIDRLPSQIVFALFNAEDWSRVGSRKFVDDIQNFVCLDYNVDDKASTGAVCNTPFKNTLDFLDVHMEKIAKIVEVGQIGLNETVFLHRQRDNNPVTNAMIENVKALAANLSTPITIGAVDSDTPGVPPSSAESFLSVNPSIGVVVLTDHAGSFINEYFQSEFDTGLNLLTDYTAGSVAVQHKSLCNKANLVARTLWMEAGGSLEGLASIPQANCSFLDQMLNCLLVDPQCALARLEAPGAFAYSTPPTHYASVYQLLPERYIADTPLFLLEILQSFVLNATSWRPPPPGANTDSWPAAPRNIHFHDAVDPNLVFDQPNNRWSIKPTANDFRLWTESNWDNGVGFRTFRVEDPRIEVVQFVIGWAVLVASIVAIATGKKYCARKFKAL